jgi:hypothetical protein
MNEMTEQVSASSTPVAADAPQASTVGVRGPKGVSLDAKILVLAAGNPKREGSKAHAVFAKYHDGMTVQEFLDSAGAEATPNLVYDAGHGFISIDGYTPTKVFVAKVKEPKAPVEAAAPKPKKEKVAKAAKPKKTVEAAPVAPDLVVAEETID